MSRSGRDGARLPVGFRFMMLAEQAAALLVVGVALATAAQGAWLTGLLDQRFPEAAVTAFGLRLPLTVAVPFLLPVFVGIPLALGRARPLLVVWLALVAILAVATVVESDRLNWFAFFSGVSVRLVEGPVPARRTFFALVALLGALLVVAQQSVHRHLVELARRGLPASELRVLRSRFLAYERGMLALGLAGGTALLVVVRLSMSATEAAPQPTDGAFDAFLFVLVLVALLVGFLGMLAIRGGDPLGRRGL